MENEFEAQNNLKKTLEAISQEYGTTLEVRSEVVRTDNGFYIKLNMPTKDILEQHDINPPDRLRSFFSSVWSLRWVAKPVGYFLPRDDREEWLGDLEEIHHQMLLEEDYPVWFINLIIATKTLLLVWSAIEVHIMNLLNQNSGA